MTRQQKTKRVEGFPRAAGRSGKTGGTPRHVTVYITRTPGVRDLLVSGQSAVVHRDPLCGRLSTRAEQRTYSADVVDMGDGHVILATDGGPLAVGLCTLCRDYRDGGLGWHDVALCAPGNRRAADRTLEAERARRAATGYSTRAFEVALRAEDLVDVFFPPVGGSNTAPARALCAACSARGECLDFAVSANLEFGVFGDTVPKERRAIRAAGSRSA